MSSLHRGHDNLLRILLILVYVLPEASSECESDISGKISCAARGSHFALVYTEPLKMFVSSAKGLKPWRGHFVVFGIPLKNSH